VEVGYGTKQIDAMIASGLIADRPEMLRLKAARGTPQES
jgi:hypothetical protein